MLKKENDLTLKSYPQNVLDEFDELITKKISEARAEYDSLAERLEEISENVAGNLLENSAEAVSLEELRISLARQKMLLENLNNALIRVRNKTYGVCRETGELIPVERLRAVPHTTLSIDAKKNRPV